MRNVLGILALVAVLAVGVTAQADYILVRDSGGGSTLDIGGTDYTVTASGVDDTFISYFASYPTAASNWTNYGQDATTSNTTGMRSGPVGSGEQHMLIGFKGIESLIPAGATITSAKLGIHSTVDTSTYLTYWVAVNKNWLTGAAGTNEGTGGNTGILDNVTLPGGAVVGKSNGPSLHFIDSNGTGWGNNQTNESFFSSTNQNFLTTTNTSLNTSYASDNVAWAVNAWVQYDITNMVKAWDNGTIPNYGLTMGYIKGTGNKVYAYTSEQTGISADYIPYLFVEYTTGEGIPEPGTMLLLGTGVLGLLGYLRRKRMK